MSRPLACRLARLVAAGAVLASVPAAASGEPPRVVLAGVPANVAEATVTALDPWRIDVVQLPADPALAGSALPRAQQLAIDHRAAAVVWLDRGAGGLTLRLYDAKRQHLEARPLASGPPFSDPVAASIALSIKTFLRQGGVAGDSPPAIGAGTRDRPAAPRPDQPDDQADDKADDKAEKPDRRDERPGPGSARSDGRRLALAVALELRPGRRAGPSTEPRLALAASFSPPVLFPSFALAAELATGPGVTVARGGFIGEFHDLTVRGAVRGLLPVNARLALAADAGVSVHATRIDGRLAAGDRPAEARRVNTHLGLTAHTRYLLHKRVYASFHIRGEYALRTQRYVVNDAPVVELYRGVVELGAGLEFDTGW